MGKTLGRYPHLQVRRYVCKVRYYREGRGDEYRTQIEESGVDDEAKEKTREQAQQYACSDTSQSLQSIGLHQITVI
jgi:hypothetical protein